MRVSIIVPFLNSHELVRRHLLYLSRLNIPDDVEIIFADDGSDPPLTPSIQPKNLRIFYTNEHRPWTSSLARNRVARENAKGEYYFMIDGDYVIPQQTIDFARTFDGQRIGCRRELATLDENGVMAQDVEELVRWGVPRERLRKKGFRISSHPNSFIIHRDVFWRLGGYDEERILSRTYPQGEDMWLKRAWAKARDAGWAKDPPSDTRPMIYMLPNGQYCGDVDANPFGLFHTLSRKTDHNHWYLNPRKA